MKRSFNVLFYTAPLNVEATNKPCEIAGEQGEPGRWFSWTICQASWFMSQAASSRL
jgi:hypothetical protein